MLCVSVTAVKHARDAANVGGLCEVAGRVRVRVGWAARRAGLWARAPRLELRSGDAEEREEGRFENRAGSVGWGGYMGFLV